MMGHFSFGGQPCKLRCPKCRKQNMHISEVWDGNGIYFTVTHGVMPTDADDHFAGTAVRLECHCVDCDHRWRARGITNIYDAVDDQTPAQEPGAQQGDEQ